MTCEDCRDGIADVALGMPVESLPSLVRAHVESCAACTERLSGDRALAGGVDAALGRLLAAQPDARLLERVRSAHAAAQRGRPASWWLPAAAAVLLALLWAGRVHAPTPAARVAAAPAASATPAAEPAPSAPRRSVPAARATRTPVAVRRPGAATAEPRVLVDAGELRLLLRAAAPRLEDGRAAAEDPLPPIDIPDIQIAALEGAIERRTP